MTATARKPLLELMADVLRDELSIVRVECADGSFWTPDELVKALADSLFWHFDLIDGHWAYPNIPHQDKPRAE